MSGLKKSFKVHVQCVLFTHQPDGCLIPFPSDPSGALLYMISYHQLVKPRKMRTPDYASLIEPTALYGNVSHNKLFCVNKDLNMPASIAKNAQEGSRSEYLAQYALSSFGTSIPVPHPEDSGIDLYCTLGRRVGKRFLVENHYLVQVKSNKDPISYNGIDEIKWLLSHKYPFLICIVNKKDARLEIYQTISLATLAAKNNIERITFQLKEPDSGDIFPDHLNNTEIEIYLGSPIVRFSTSNFTDSKFNKEICDTLKSWIELDQENIELKSTGLSLYRLPLEWKTNNPVKKFQFKGNFKDTFENDNPSSQYFELICKLLSYLVNKAAADKDIEKYISLINFFNTNIATENIKDSSGVRILQFCINHANEHLGINL